MDTFVRVMDRISVACAVFAAVLLFSAVLIVCWMVIYRAMGNSAWWEIEVAVYIMVGSVFLASPYTLKTNGHVGVDILGHYLPHSAARIVGIVTGVLSLLVCVYLGYKGLVLTLESIHKSETTGSLLNAPKWPLFITMPVGLGLTALQYIAELFRDPEHLVPKPEAVAHDAAEFHAEPL